MLLFDSKNYIPLNRLMVNSGKQLSRHVLKYFPGVFLKNKVDCESAQTRYSVSGWESNFRPSAYEVGVLSMPLWFFFW